MFKFNFSSDNRDEAEPEPLATDTSDACSLLNKEVDGREIEVSNSHKENIKQCYNDSTCSTTVHGFHLVDLKHVEQFVCSQPEEKFECLRFANQLNSDVISGVYEGGLKIWECTIDLLDYLDRENINFNGLSVLDLGCGAGLLGLYALSKGAATVHFQDFNAEVLDLITIPNVLLNNSQKPECNTKFFAGDWGSLLHKLHKYDMILTSETIYNPENYLKLLKVFEETLLESGTIYLAAKHHYFGVGGNIRQFEKLLLQSQKWNASTSFSVNEGVKREILKLTWKCAADQQ